ncbi:LPXTG cell wall anchor domain-containing protein [Streptomyces sp. NPDC002889]|uniref:LPXTG cell wall anchor domain-containing protein n=1 Tax=Streptomyces sp. NPDC002889 TaxID=3364669 RepID=UPI0036A15016
MRTLTSTGALVTAAALTLMAAPTALATPHGDNGTVKIHDATTGEELRKNEPKVCTFYLDAFGFDAGQQVDWHIEAWANNDLDKGETVRTGSLTLDADGHERTEDMTLPDGQYKLFWNFEGENGSAKHKVFKTDCDDAAETPAPSGTPSETPGGETGGEPSAPAEEEPSGPAASSPAGAEPTSAPSADGVTGDLAETGNGAPIGVLATIAAALVAGGGFLLARRRTSRQS